MAHTITGLRLDVDGNLDKVEVARMNGSHLASMRNHIGCRTVDLFTVPSPHGAIDAWVDDEGAYMAPPNILASVILGFLSRRRGTRIYGTALLLASDGEETVGLTDDQADHIITIQRAALRIPELAAQILLARNGVS